MNLKTPSSLLALVVMLAGMATLVHFACACGAQAAQQDAVRASYATDIELCVSDAGSRAQADACRAAVDARYGVDAGIGGAK